MQKDKFLAKIKNSSEIVTNNLIKLFALDIDDAQFNVWSDEVWMHLHRLRKSDRVFKRQNLLSEILIWSDFSQLRDRVTYIVRHNVNYDLKDSAVDLSILHSQIHNYFTWLIDMLYDNGVVSESQVKEAIVIFGSKE